MTPTMKTKFLVVLAILWLTAGAPSRAQTPATNSYFQSVSLAIPDDNPNGVFSTINISGLIGTVSNLSVSLNISSGYNGDLYAYLVGSAGGFAVLLNRVGVGGADPFGYGDTGFDVTFTTAAANNIHFYQNLGYTTNGSGQLTGIWGADGRDIDPDTQNSPPPRFDTAATTNTINLFLGTDPNGDWTLFVADMSGSLESFWENWQLDLVTVPEPSALTLLAALGVIGVAAGVWRRACPGLSRRLINEKPTREQGGL
jgi:subtilisin-like proprotein convertase family protein